MAGMARLAAASAAIAVACCAAHGQYVMVPDWTDRVMLFSAVDGSLVNPDFIPDNPGVWNFESPREAIQVGNEIWVTDQISDSIFRFTASLTPQYIGTISGAMDNLRGLTLINGTVYVCNAGTVGGAPGNAVILFDMEGTRLGHFAVNDCHDVQLFGGDLVITNQSGHRIDKFALDGTPLGVFHNSDGVTGIDLPLQMQVESDGTLMVGGSLAPAGIYHYDVNGVQVSYAPVGGVRGVFRLDNGKILFSRNNIGFAPGVFTYDPATGEVTPVYSHPTDSAYTNIQWMGRLTLGTGCGTADFDGDGDVGTDADIEAFFACLSGSCCATCWHLGADFDADGDSGTDADIEAFFRVLGGGTC
jgi:hypothetical protein